MTGDTAAAVDFLCQWAPNGPWTLTSIVPDGAVETRSFVKSALAAMRKWLDSCQGERNLYFSVNPLINPGSVKAKKDNVERMSWLHVDLDPRPGEDFHMERARALKLLTEFVPTPTVLLDSGGGYQAFWKLDEDDRLIINGDVAKAESLELYNQQLERLLGGDHCFNCDRIMRLPGTVNLPNAKKRKKGRQAAAAKLVHWFADRVYKLTQFTPAVRVQSTESGLTNGPPKVHVSGNVTRLRSIEDLREWGVSEPTMALILQGEDPADPTRYSSRSEALFRAICELIRNKVPDETIYSVITDPAFAISTSVREKRGSDRYALRQIERAKEEVDEPWLRRLNERHAVISDMGGKCRIISEVWDETLARTKISKQSFEDFRNRYCNSKVQVGTTPKGAAVYVAAGAFWIGHPLRRQYDTIVFAPGRDVEGVYNLWKGFACDAIPGERHHGLLEHIRQNLCSGDETAFKFILGWMARAVQHPDSPGECALVFRGRMGTGKGFLAKTFGSLFGRHFLQVTSAKHMTGNFNAHLRDCVVLFADEAFYAGDKQHEGILRALITEETLVVEGKGVDAETAPNYLHTMVASNNSWVIPAGLEERRFLVLDVGDKRLQDTVYFGRLRAELNAGGRENLLHFLLQYDLTDFEPRRPPATGALQDQKLLTMPPEEQWMFHKLWHGNLLHGDMRWPASVVKDRLYDDYILELQKQGRNYRMSPVAFGKFMQKAMPEGAPRVRQDWADVPMMDEHGYNMTQKKRVVMWDLPPLLNVRKHWDNSFGGPHKWPQVMSEQVEAAMGDVSPF